MNIPSFMLQHPDVYDIEFRRNLAFMDGQFTDITMRVDKGGLLFAATRAVDRHELELVDDYILNYLYAQIEKEISDYEDRKA